MNLLNKQQYVQKLLTKEFLIHQYFELNKSIYDIEKEFVVGKTSVGVYLKKYELVGVKKKFNFLNILTKQYLIEEYVKNKRSINEILNQIGCSQQTILNYLKKYGISVRLGSVENTGNFKLVNLNKQIVQELYNKFWAIERIAKKFNVSDKTIYKYFNLFNLKTRKGTIGVSGKRHPKFGKKYPKHSERMKGKNNPNWQNGISKLPYSFEFTINLKQEIRERDNYTCQNCGLQEVKHLILFDRLLAIHHIDYNKQNCNKSNLITLCNICNSTANGNRDYWFAYYTYIIENYIKEK